VIAILTAIFSLHASQMERNEVPFCEDSSVAPRFNELYNFRTNFNPEYPKGGSFSKIYRINDCNCIVLIKDFAGTPIDTTCINSKYLDRKTVRSFSKAIEQDSLSNEWLRSSKSYKKFDAILEQAPWRGLSTGISLPIESNPIPELKYRIVASWSGLNLGAEFDSDSEFWVMPGIGLGSMFLLQCGKDFRKRSNSVKAALTIEQNFFDEARSRRRISVYHIPSISFAIGKHIIGRDDWVFRAGVALDIVKIRDYILAKNELKAINQSEQGVK
jgi:hypothetical protein